MVDEFDIQGLDELERSLISLDAEMGVKTLRSAGREAMKPVLATAQQKVNVDSGDLSDALAISAKKGKGNTAVQINVGATRKKATKKQGGRKFANVNQKAIAQEFGTSKQKAEPFLRPALDQNAGIVVASFVNALSKKIDKAFKKAGR